MKLDGIYRNEGYTTDGIFLIKSELENAYLRRQVELEAKPQIKKLLDNIWKEGITQEMTAVNEPYMLPGNSQKVQKFSCSEFDTFINPDYLWFFKGIKDKKFKSTGTLKPLQVFAKNKATNLWELVGLIMTIRIEKD